MILDPKIEFGIWSAHKMNLARPFLHGNMTKAFIGTYIITRRKVRRRRRHHNTYKLACHLL